MWKKEGHIFNVNSKYDWNKSHAQVPVCFKKSGDVWRIFYASRDEDNKSSTAYIDVEAGNPKNILNESSMPILTHGKLGAFDDCGVMPSTLIRVDDKIYMYYIGWSVRKTIPYHNSIGLAFSEDNGGSFKRYAEGPIVSQSMKEPYFTGTSWVTKNNDSWNMWYLSCTGWKRINNKSEPFYHIKRATSNDGIHWERRGEVAIDYKNSSEAAIANACVINIGNIYKMWYCYRGSENYRVKSENSYRIGLAESQDMKNWTRKDENVGINVSDDGWDSEMIAYPNVIKHENQLFMFYNGNGFGKTGFGYATKRI